MGDDEEVGVVVGKEGEVEGCCRREGYWLVEGMEHDLGIALFLALTEVEKGHSHASKEGA